jgi:hypothetical protein
LYWFQASIIPWGQWIGCESKNPLYSGDKPEQYAELKAVAGKYDPRFAQIARCTGVCLEKDRGKDHSSENPSLADGNVPPATPGKEIVHDKKDRR